MITRRAFWVGVAASVVPLCAWLAKAERDRDKIARATLSLIEISSWAWGGIGILQTISVGQSAFRTVAQATPEVAAKTFETVYAKAKPAGRLYALLGLRDLAPIRFERLLPASLHSSAVLESVNGCIVDTDTEENIARLISAGAWASGQGPTRRYANAS